MYSGSEISWRSRIGGGSQCAGGRRALSEGYRRRHVRNGRILGATMVGACLVGIVGCGSSVDGTPTATVPTRDAESIQVYNPCTELSADVLRATGVDPASKTTVTDPPSGPSSWRVCAWFPDGNPYGMTVFSTSHTLDETRSKDTIVDIRETKVGQRTAISFREKSDPDGCFIAFEAEQGMFEISTSWLSSGKRDVDSCVISSKHATDIEPHLPK
ncbi:DUF3558 domain-containing protein [Nocardia sp. NPDC058705]|uniref:DUF3558 domain-containing protein n=1 Tax=Nocardia sp. NPDC058705 TaxID=3346609 RepID=UPI0036C4B0D4